ncbi:hypothetical protein ACFWWT_39695 [Streptomyces sp. NPDC058676]|uniref:hypothetical protein n=1 Tax=unclassified Streptomyces TaxID=2593676 RepID=UPI003659BB77
MSTRRWGHASSVARELGISYESVRGWVDKAKNAQATQSAPTAVGLRPSRSPARRAGPYQEREGCVIAVPGTP